MSSLDSLGSNHHFILNTNTAGSKGVITNETCVFAAICAMELSWTSFVPVSTFICSIIRGSNREA